VGVENPLDHLVFFDNFFTTHALMGVLGDMNFKATGTVRENRLKGCPLEANRDFKKKPRGSYDFR
jgi:hypothetical protein